MIWFKLCPRCNGDLYYDHDEYGRFVTCAQCGFGKDMIQRNTETSEITAEPVRWWLSEEN